MTTAAKDRLIVALDVPTLDEAVKLVKELKGSVGVFKAGLELYAHCGTRLFEAMRAEGVPFFFDCKFLDIPNTVARASEGLVGQGITMFNIHATGGFIMLAATAAAVKKRAAEMNVVAPKILAVTVLTSIGDRMLREELGVNLTAQELVPKLALLAKDAGLDGVVASAREVKSIRDDCGPDFLIVTPGIRPSWAGSDDQARTATPKEAMQNGSDYLVIGRPITQAANRVEAARRIVEEMES